MRSHSGTRTGNRYDEPMVSHDVSEETPGTPLLVARLHVDLGRLASAICPSGTAVRPVRAAL
nr:putative leader peptide [Streptomyces bikiniensis]